MKGKEETKTGHCEDWGTSFLSLTSHQPTIIQNHQSHLEAQRQNKRNTAGTGMFKGKDSFFPCTGHILMTSQIKNIIIIIAHAGTTRLDSCQSILSMQQSSDFC